MSWDTIQSEIDQCTRILAVLSDRNEIELDDVQEIVGRIDSVRKLLPRRSSFVETALSSSIILLETIVDSHFRSTDNTQSEHRQERENDKNANELDSFASDRVKAVERTIVSEISSLPHFSSVVGLQEAKVALLEALEDPINYPQWFESGDLKPWKSILLFGPPGTGKTHLARSVVRQIQGTFYQLSSADLISSWAGQSERLIRELFDHAILRSSKEAVVIFIDEIDSLCRERSSKEEDNSRRIKTEFLVQSQRLRESKRAMLICATNCPWDLDPAMLRRFEKKIYIGLPSADDRNILFKQLLKSTTFENDNDIEWIAEQTVGFTGDDIRRFSSELAFMQFRQYKASLAKGLQNASQRVPLSREDVTAALSTFQLSVDESQLDRFKTYMAR